MTRRIVALGIVVLSGAFLTGSALAQIPVPPDGAKSIGQKYTGRSYSPYAVRDFPDVVFWGDTHLHTSFSMETASSCAGQEPGW